MEQPAARAALALPAEPRPSASAAMSLATPAVPRGRLERVVEAGGPYLLMVLALVIALAAWLATRQVNSQADSRRRAQLFLAQLEQEASRLRLLEERALREGSSTATDLAASDRAIGQAMAELERLDPGGDAVARVSEALDEYLANAAGVFERLQLGDPEGARQWFRERSAPSFELLSEAAFLSTAFYSAQATRALRRSQLGTAGAIGAEALLIGVLSLIFERNRRATAARFAAERARSEAHFRSLVQNSADVISVLDQEGTVRYSSPAVKRVLGYSPEDRIGKSTFTLLHPDDRPTAQNALAKVLAGPGATTRLELRASHVDGSFRWIEVSAVNLLDDPNVGGVVLNYRDVTERRHLQEQLRHQALHDPLTQLANRALFKNLVEHALASVDRHQRQVAVLYIDLDGFKQVNDTLGHEAGDQLLIAVAERLRFSLRGGDAAARLGGDEFAVLLDQADESIANLVAERILGVLRKPVLAGGQEVRVDASLGITLSGLARRDPGELLNEADLAMYVAKSEGKGRIVLYRPGLEARVKRGLTHASDFERALERQEFTLHYQPIVSLADGRVTGVEALVRWRNPDEDSLLPPAEFLPLAEEIGFMIPLGRWVMREACHQVGMWQTAFPSDPPLVLSVNLSAGQFHDAGLVDDIVAVLGSSGLPASSLVLEVTESVLMKYGRLAAGKLGELRKLGVRLAIDNFGGNHSALSYLRELPVDIVKIDRSNVLSLGASGSDRELMQGIVALALKLNLLTVAEGVELDGQYTRLDAMGCELGQGYFFSRPQVPAVIEAVLRAVATGGDPRITLAAAVGEGIG